MKTVQLPATDRVLLGPGPSPVSARVLQALAAPPRSHLDPEMIAILDDLRARLAAVFRAPGDALTLAVSGTGTAAMETAAANLVEHGMSALVVVNGYFGDRLAQVLKRQGAYVERLHAEWGRAADPGAVERALADGRFDVVAVVHAETSTGVVNPVADIARLARQRDALVIVDAVTSLGAMPVDVAGWDIDVCYSCSQKGLGAPSGLGPIAFSVRALARRVKSRSFYLDIGLIDDFWRQRRYHHTISAPLIYALHAALGEVKDEGLEARWQRHERHHLALAAALEQIGLELLPPPGERLWSLNAVRVPAGVDDALIRSRLLTHHQIEIGAGLGPLAGKVFRIGLMGSGSTIDNVNRVVAALAEALGRKRPK